MYRWQFPVHDVATAWRFSFSTHEPRGGDVAPAVEGASGWSNQTAVSRDRSTPRKLRWSHSPSRSGECLDELPARSSGVVAGAVPTPLQDGLPAVPARGW